MKFEFLKIPIKPSLVFPNRTFKSRPTIPIRLINKFNSDLFIRTNAMIDTGADYIMAPVEFMPRLGLPLEIREDKEIVVESVMKNEGDMRDEKVKSLGIFCDIIIEIKEQKFNTHACFTTKIDEVLQVIYA